jgi:hypothetical protein
VGFHCRNGRNQVPKAVEFVESVSVPISQQRGVSFAEPFMAASIWEGPHRMASSGFCQVSSDSKKSSFWHLLLLSSSGNRQYASISESCPVHFQKPRWLIIASRDSAARRPCTLQPLGRHALHGLGSGSGPGRPACWLSLRPRSAWATFVMGLDRPFCGLIRLAPHLRSARTFPSWPSSLIRPTHFGDRLSPGRPSCQAASGVGWLELTVGICR